MRFPHHALDDVALDALPTFLPNQADKVDCSGVLAALAQVDEVYQSAVALFYLEDYSCKEIAEILQIPMGTVRSRIFRGLAQLRQLIGLSVDEVAPETITEQANEEASECLVTSLV
jgi:RNA polymerase sigma-70 factor (ECF subfamily)